jgi:hypothetical protein
MKTRNVIRLAALAATTLVVAACGGSGGGSNPPGMSNSAPMISAIPDKGADQDTTLDIDFTVDDRDTGAGSLTVEAAADGTGLFPADGMMLSGSGATRTLTLTPLEATAGMATIAIRAVDPQGASVTRTFQVAVNARNASIRAMALDTFAKGEADAPTTINGWTIEQDADDPAVFAALLGAG